MSALALLLALASQEPVATREERVLELLRDLEREERSWRYHGSTFAPWKRDGEVGQLVPSYFLMCATLSSEIDDRRFRTLGLEILRAYGLAPEAGVAWSDSGVAARLDALDRTAGIGFELRERGDSESRGVPEADANALDDAELERLRASGMRLYVAECERWFDDDDGFTPALAFAADLVRFLNERVDGDDVDLDGLVFEYDTTWVWQLRPPTGMRLEDGEYGPVLVVERPGTVTIPCQGWPDFGKPIVIPGSSYSPPAGRVGQFSTRGAPSVVAVMYSAAALQEGGPRLHFRARYRQSIGSAPELVHETRDSLVAFLPSAFDLAQPFTLELELEPGRYSFYGGSTRVGASARGR